MPLTDLSPWAVAGLTWVALLALLALALLVVRLLPAPASDGDTQELPVVDDDDTVQLPAIGGYEGRHRADGWNPVPLYRVPAGFRRAVREGRSIGWVEFGRRPAW